MANHLKGGRKAPGLVWSLCVLVVLISQQPQKTKKWKLEVGPRRLWRLPACSPCRRPCLVLSLQNRELAPGELRPRPNWRTSATPSGSSGSFGFAPGASQQKLRACNFLAEHEPRYRPLASSSSSTNQFSDNGEGEFDKAEGPNESSDVGNDEKAEEERLAEEQSRRRLEELTRQAMEEARLEKEAEILFQMSQRAYGRGVYDKSVEMLEAALSNVPGSSNLGGEIQIWLAMAYDAVGRHADCIALYKRLEGSHPNKNLRKQAADLRFIAEAPRLKISRDEMVKIPLIEKDYDRKAKSWSQLVKEKRKKPMKKSAQTRDYMEDWLVWKPPRWEKSPYFWVALTIWLTLVGISLVFQN